MNTLSGLINEALEARGQLEFDIQGKGQFHLWVSSSEDGNYGFRARFQGNASPRDAPTYMADFLRRLPVSDLRSSELALRMKNGEQMCIKQYSVPDSIYCMYHVDFFYPDGCMETLPITPALVEIVKNVYGINFKPATQPWTVYPGPFGSDNPPEQGVMMPLSFNRVQGTPQEEKAREVILRSIKDGQLSESDIEALKDYDRALVDDVPRLYRLHGLVFQNESKTTNAYFIDFLNNISEEVDLVHLKTFYDKALVSMTNGKISRNNLEPFVYEVSTNQFPNMEVGGTLLTASQKDNLLDHTWNKYHLLTGDSIDLVRNALNDVG